MLEKLEAVLRTTLFVSNDVAEFEELHELGKPPHADVEVWLDESVAMDELVGTPAELSLGRTGEEPRLFRGVVESIELAAAIADEPLDLKLVYRLRIVSALGLLALKSARRAVPLTAEST